MEGYNIKLAFDENKDRIYRDYEKAMNEVHEKYTNMIMNLNVLYHMAEADIQPLLAESNMIRQMLDSGYGDDALLSSRLSEIESEIEELWKKFYAESSYLGNEN